MNKIALGVLLAHFAALLWVSIDHCFSPQTKIQKRIAIRTFTPPPPSHFIAKAPVKTTPAPAAKKQPSKKEAPKKADKPAPKKAPEAEKKLKAAPIAPPALPAPPETKTVELAVPALLKTHQSKPLIEEVSISVGAADYGSILAQALKIELGQFPEIGDVRASLTLDAPGRIASIEILQAESEKNAEWLKKQLPMLELPCFNDFGITDARLQFTIMFRNEDPA